MIIVRLIGGLGNQMFQYALGRRLSLMHNVPLKLDISEFTAYKLRKYSLNIFNIVEDIATASDLRFFNTKLLSTADDVPYYEKPTIEQQTYNFDPNIFKAVPPIYLKGSWQSEKYFISIKDVIVNDFSIKPFSSSHHMAVASRIASSNSIAIHIRRGDYVSNPETNRFHGVCPIEYYTDSLKVIARQVENPNIFVFSDDPAWAKDHLKSVYPTTYLEPSDSTYDAIDLWLISQCKHQIIANSTFSWWGAWLNTNPHKIVCAPEKWFDSASLNTDDLIPSSWLKIPYSSSRSEITLSTDCNISSCSGPAHDTSPHFSELQVLTRANGNPATHLRPQADFQKKNILLTTSAPPDQTPFSTTEKRPPIGIGFLISVLRDTGHNVFFIDNYLSPSNFLETDYLQRHQIDCVGIYTNTICYRDSLRMFYRLEEMRIKGSWKGKIIVGGPHASVSPETIPPFVDHIVIGEGEYALRDILDGKVTERIVRYPSITDLDELPMPAWDYFAELPYNWGGNWLPEAPVFTMNTSRGCPFDCTFCSVGSIWGRRYTYFSAERVVADIEYVITHHGAKGIYFREDNFTLNKKRLYEFCNLMIAKNLNIPWVCETRASSLDRETVELMARAGAKGAYIGVESGSQRLLDFMHKAIKLEDVRRAFQLCHEFGINTAASVIVGVPTETEQDRQMTVDLLAEIKPTVSWFNVFVGIPRSKLYEYVLSQKLYEYIDDRGLVYLKGHNEQVKRWYGQAWDAGLPVQLENNMIVNPRISVIMSVHNGEKHLLEAIRSIQRQTYNNFEFIIVDDASTDSTPAILDGIDDPRIRVFRNQCNIGLTRSLNKALKHCRGEFIARMDADDFSIPHRLASQSAYLENNPSVVLVGSAYYVMNDEDAIVAMVDVLTDPDDIYNDLIRQNWFGHGSVMIRKSCLCSVGGYDEEFIYAQDYDLFLRLSETCKLANIAEPLYLWRKSQQGISLQKAQEQKYFAMLARKRAVLRRSATACHSSTPLVSVIVPTHNRPDMLREAIESILDQTFQDFEIIVVNDAGQDVEPVVRSFNNPRIRYISHDTNKGLAATRNTAIRAARGKYIAYLDDDDIYYPEHLETLVNFLENRDGSVAYTDAYRAYQEKCGDKYIITGRDVPYSFDFDYDRIMYQNFVPVLCFMHRRDCIEATGYFDETMSSHEDWDLWIRMSRMYKFYHIASITCEFRWSTDGSTMSSSKLADYLCTTELIYEKYKHITKNSKHISEEQVKSLKSRRLKLLKSTSKISIIIPVFNKCELTLQCIDALYKYRPSCSFELIVVDNASTDGTADYLSTLSTSIRVIRNQQNLGFALACNQGAQQARGSYLVFLNNDTIPLEGWLDELVIFTLTHPDAGIVGSKLLYPDDTIQHCGASMRHDGAFFRHQYKYFHRYHPLVNRVRELDAVTAACFMTPRELFMQLGGFDEQYLNGCEDMDYCTAVRNAGYRIYINPASELYHLESQTPRTTNRDLENFARYCSKWGIWRMKNEIELYAEDGFWRPRDTTSYEPVANAPRLLEDLRNTFNPLCPNAGTMFRKIATRIYPVPYWTKTSPDCTNGVRGELCRQ